MTHILLVEDNDLNRDMLSRRLIRAGYTVSFAMDGQEAVDQVTASDPDLVLMDLGLPVLDGWEATQRVRAGGWQGPIIALTAHAMSGDEKRALDAGCNDFDTKPVDIARLLGKIRTLIPDV